MKNFKRFTLFTLTLFLIFACSKDDEELSPPDNSFIYNETKYEINDVVLRYDGLTDLTHKDSISENTHHLFDLFFTDGIVEFDCPAGCYSNAIGTNASYFVSVRFATVASDHSDEFPLQTYSGILPQVFHAGDSPTNSDFYTSFFFRIDEGDHEFNPTDIFVDGSEGTITFAKSGNEYMVTIDVIDTDTTNNLSIKGSYTGAIEKVNL